MSRSQATPPSRIKRAARALGTTVPGVLAIEDRLRAERSQSLGSFLRLAMRRRHVSEGSLARRLAVHPKAVRQLLEDPAVARFGLIERAAAALDAHVELRMMPSEVRAARFIVKSAAAIGEYLFRLGMSTSACPGCRQQAKREHSKPGNGARPREMVLSALAMTIERMSYGATVDIARPGPWLRRAREWRRLIRDPKGSVGAIDEKKLISIAKREVWRAVVEANAIIDQHEKQTAQEQFRLAQRARRTRPHLART